MDQIEQAAREFVERMRAEHDSLDPKARPHSIVDFEGYMVKQFAAFAREQVAERERRIADELEDLLSGEFVDNSPSAFRSRLSTEIDRLRGKGGDDEEMANS